MNERIVSEKIRNYPKNSDNDDKDKCFYIFRRPWQYSKEIV